VALAVAGTAWSASASAAVVDIITVSNFHSTASGTLQSYIENVSGYFTTTPGQLSNLTATEYAGQTYTYDFTTPYLGSAWTEPTQIGSVYTASPTASFNFGLHAGSGPVWNDVEVTLTEGIFNVGGGTVTLTESFAPLASPGPTSGAGPAGLAFLLVLGTAGLSRGRRSQRSSAS
jgi:hypothetical protein